MQTHPTGRHYQNATVYRSAQRLLASRPARRPTPRSLVFIVGLACGIGVALLLLWPIRMIDAAALHAEGTSAETTNLWNKLFAVRPTVNRGGDATTFRRSTKLESSNQPRANGDATPATPQSSRNANGAQPITTKTSSEAAAAQSSPASAAVARDQIIKELYFRGRWNRFTENSETVEFQLYLTLAGLEEGVVKGIVRWPAAKEPKEIRVSGSWFNLMMTLWEGESLPTAPLSFSGYMFTLDFPDTSASDEVRVLWEHGKQHGSLLLKPVPRL